MDEFYEERDTGTGRPSGSSASDRDHSHAGPTHSDTSPQQPRWQVDADWGWHDFEPEDQSALTNSWNNYVDEITLRDRKKTYYIDFSKMTQTNAKTNKVRTIRWGVDEVATFAPNYIEGTPSAGRGHAVIQPAWKKKRSDYEVAAGRFGGPPERAPERAPHPQWRAPV